MSELRDAQIEDLFEALTDSRCTSYEDIASATGWNLPTVGSVLSHMRQPAVAEEWGWTVPHVARGRGDHWYQVIAIDQSPLELDQLQHIKSGAVSTLRHVETMGVNEAHGIRLAAMAAEPLDARRMKRAATAFEGAAAMAGDMAEQMSEWS